MNLSKDNQGQHNDDSTLSGSSGFEPSGFAGGSAAPPISLPPLAGVSGLGGWLVLIQIGLYGSLLLNIYQLFAYSLPVILSDTWQELTTPGSIYYHPNWKPALLVELFSMIAIIVYVTFILIAFYRKKSRLPMMMILFYAASATIAVLQYAMLSSIANVDEAAGTTAADLVRSILTAAIWIWYFLVSQRVRNTFIR